jgi:hypothetical protein
MRTRFMLLIVLTICSVPLVAAACEPIFPIVQLLAGSSLAGPALITRSFVWLLVAIAIKCFAFVFLQHRLRRGQSVSFMLIANVISTIPGLLIAAFVGSVSGIILAIPLTIVLALVVGRRWKRLAAQAGEKVRVSGGVAALIFSAVFFGSIILYEFAAGALAGRDYGAYWILKFAFVTLVACSGILISAVLEECVIARLARKSTGDISFFTPVLRANYITLGVVLLFAALQLLPARLRAPNFIVSWLSTISSSM